MIKNIFWFWESEISPAVCDLLLSEVDTAYKTKGIVGKYDYKTQVSSAGVNSEYRNVEVVFEKYNKPFGSILYTHGVSANYNGKWNFDLNYAEDTQITYYTKGCHHALHADSLLNDEPFFKDWVRKITNIMFLSNPEDYEGGELILRSGPGEDSLVYFKPPKGSIISFPSFIEHQVTEVTSGERVTAVSWINGPLFK